MDYEVLRKFQRIERNASNLAEISTTFYSELAALIKDQAQKYEKSHSIEDAKTLDNIRKIALDIFDKREQKLMLKALRCVRNNESECNAVELEKTLLDRVQEVLKSNRDEFDRIIMGEGFVPPAVVSEILSEKLENIQEPAQSEDLNMVLVRILKDVPKFVSPEMKEIGPFEANEIKRLPEKEATFLSDNKFAERI